MPAARRLAMHFLRGGSPGGRALDLGRREAGEAKLAALALCSHPYLCHDLRVANPRRLPTLTAEIKFIPPFADTDVRSISPPCCSAAGSATLRTKPCDLLRGGDLNMGHPGGIGLSPDFRSQSPSSPRAGHPSLEQCHFADSTAFNETRTPRVGTFVRRHPGVPAQGAGRALVNGAAPRLRPSGFDR